MEEDPKENELENGDSKENDLENEEPKEHELEIEDFEEELGDQFVGMYIYFIKKVHTLKTNQKQPVYSFWLSH